MTSHTCRVWVTSTLCSTCSTTSFWNKTLHVDSDLGTAPTIFLCRLRSRLTFDLYDMSSPTQLQWHQSRWHVICWTHIQTWIQLQVSHTRTTMLTSHVEYRLLFHCCVLYYHMMTSHVIYGFIQSLNYQFKGTHASSPPFQPWVESDLNVHIQATSKNG